jgi:hypothetical protein
MAIGALLRLTLASRGSVPSESNLVGTWQVGLPHRQKMVFDFQRNHTYTLAMTGQAGALQGTGMLDGNILTTMVKS